MRAQCHKISISLKLSRGKEEPLKIIRLYLGSKTRSETDHPRCVIMIVFLFTVRNLVSFPRPRQITTHMTQSPFRCILFCILLRDAFSLVRAAIDYHFRNECWTMGRACLRNNIVIHFLPHLIQLHEWAFQRSGCVTATCRVRRKCLKAILPIFFVRRISLQLPQLLLDWKGSFVLQSKAKSTFDFYFSLQVVTGSQVLKVMSLNFFLSFF